MKNTILMSGLLLLLASVSLAGVVPNQRGFVVRNDCCQNVGADSVYVRTSFSYRALSAHGDTLDWPTTVVSVPYVLEVDYRPFANPRHNWIDLMYSINGSNVYEFVARDSSQHKVVFNWLTFSRELTTYEVLDLVKRHGYRLPDIAETEAFFKVLRLKCPADFSIIAFPGDLEKEPVDWSNIPVSRRPPDWRSWTTWQVTPFFISQAGFEGSSVMAGKTGLSRRWDPQHHFLVVKPVPADRYEIRWPFAHHPNPGWYKKFTLVGGSAYHWRNR